MLGIVAFERIRKRKGIEITIGRTQDENHKNDLV